MQNITLYLLFLFIVTGLLFTGCGTEVEEPSEVGEPSVLEEMILEEVEEEVKTVEPVAEEVKVQTQPQTQTQTKSSSVSSDNSSDNDEPEDDSVYEDGTYQETGAYTNPAGPETIGVTLTIKDDVVTGVGIRKDGINETTKKFQTLFVDGISALVVGKGLDEIGTFSSVNGSSLTPKGFQDALEAIKVEAAG